MTRTNKTTTTEIQATEFETAGEAIQYMYAGGRGVAIQMGDKPMVVDQAAADRLAAAGAQFAYLCDHEMPDGSHQIVTIPVN